ncbi:hypothetical protein Pelo_12357 [Pelomyxa schiedti]|nr:hypothetical protein Pelo_12912 [Pelomyxa schiedti]KAH3746218.1 hypothetical protein Pelo_12357 [Pelomyxa schiedti]
MLLPLFPSKIRELWDARVPYRLQRHCKVPFYKLDKVFEKALTYILAGTEKSGAEPVLQPQLPISLITSQATDVHLMLHPLSTSQNENAPNSNIIECSPEVFPRGAPHPSPFLTAPPAPSPTPPLVEPSTPPGMVSSLLLPEQATLFPQAQSGEAGTEELSAIFPKATVQRHGNSKSVPKRKYKKASPSDKDGEYIYKSDSEDDLEFDSEDSQVSCEDVQKRYSTRKTEPQLPQKRFALRTKTNSVHKRRKKEPSESSLSDYVMNEDDYRKCIRIVNAIFRHKDSSFFRYPVDDVALNIPDYHSIIKVPMDLSTVQDNLANRYHYKTCLDFASDMRLIFTNAMLYNPVGHIVHIVAEKMSVLLESKLSRAFPVSGHMTESRQIHGPSSESLAQNSPVVMDTSTLRRKTGARSLSTSTKLSLQADKYTVLLCASRNHQQITLATQIHKQFHTTGGLFHAELPNNGAESQQAGPHPIPPEQEPDRARITSALVEFFRHSPSPQALGSIVQVLHRNHPHLNLLTQHSHNGAPCTLDINTFALLDSPTLIELNALLTAQAQPTQKETST